MAGFKVVIVACDNQGNVNVEDLRSKAEQYKERLGCLMITYPSTHGVFEESITEICQVIHSNGGQVYMDGANMNAQVGLTSPANIGADVCHLNLHKTFCIPHGGGGPGVGAIAFSKHLSSFAPGAVLPRGAEEEKGLKHSVGSISASMYGSAGILPIPYLYIQLMGGKGLTRATELAILNANYMAKKLGEHYPILYKGKNGSAAHEFIIDARGFKSTAGIEAEDIAKRLMDYGFHAPTLSFPISGTLMIEPTESESKKEIDRLVESLVEIRKEIREVEEGKQGKEGNVLKNAPHTIGDVVREEWGRSYGREKAVYPVKWLKEGYKPWPAVGRIDGVYGDLNLVCTCPKVESYQEEPKESDQKKQ